MFIHYIIASLSVLLYLHGFFPLPTGNHAKSQHNTTSTAKYQRTVIVIIDALRLDFISEDKTPFLAKTYKNTGCFIHLRVETPTVTLPRIKAIVTGSVPQFADLLLNFASPTKLDDSLIHQALAKKKNVVFYGDDIWVKLFPNQFKRSEGVSSFFVNDYTEVDDNVTRNVKEEIKRNDWNLMILHYLGLDHIGHVYGPKSPLIFTKLGEMDDIIKEIYNNVDETLFIITGDHGMRDSGGHGGSTYGETNVPLLVLGLSCQNDTFSQVDIPANLAILLGFDIPTTSIGQIQYSLLKSLPTDEFLGALRYNAELLSDKMDLCDETIETAKHFHESYLLNKNKYLGNSATKLYQECQKKISEKLLKSSIKQNVYSLLIATLMLATMILTIFKEFSGKLNQFFYVEEAVILVIIILQFTDSHPNLSFISIAVTILIFLKNLVTLRIKQLPTHLSFLAVMSIVHPLIFLSSSFLEEEHQFWYFFAGTFIFLKIFDKNSKLWFLVFGVLRFVRTLNQVGDKWAALPDLADWLLKKENYIFLQLILVSGLFFSCYCNFILKQDKFMAVIDVLVVILVYLYRVFEGENVSLARVIWFLIFSKCFYCLVRRKNFLHVWILIMTLQLKPYNMILIPLCIFASLHFQKVLNDENLIMSHWWLGNLLFFVQGHDNSIASVDLSAAYIGLESYQPLLIVPQILSHTYAFPVLSHLLLFRHELNVKRYLSLFVMIRSYIILTVFIVTFIHRHHLFIWSVFAPKVFVEAFHFGFLMIEVSCYYLYYFVNKLFT